MQRHIPQREKVKPPSFLVWLVENEATYWSLILLLTAGIFTLLGYFTAYAVYLPVFTK